jgi:hypothetical protein
LPTKYKIYKYWSEWLSENKLIDEASFCCFACHDRLIKVHVSSEITERYEGLLSEQDVKDSWNNLKGVQKHHIHAKQFGGSDNVSNLFLLCRECHRKAPIISQFEKDKTLFLKWVKHQSHMDRMKYKIKKAMEWLTDSEGEKQALMAFTDKLAKEGRLRELFKHAGFHGAHININSLLASQYYHFKHRKNKQATIDEFFKKTIEK